MRRLPVAPVRVVSRILVTSLAIVLGGSLAACSSRVGPDYADGATTPAAPAATATVPEGSSAAGGTPAADIAVSGAPAGVTAKAGVLEDASTGQVLWGRAVNAERPMASITKVMTAYLVLTSGGNVNRKITIPKAVLNYVAKYGAATAGLVPGEVLTVHELLYGLLLQSGADAAYTLATTYGPGMGTFIAKMNAEAAQLGMQHTHFASPDGLPYPTETATYSTPADLVLLGQAAMKLPLFRSIVDQRFYSLQKGDGHRAHWWGNDNGLIGSYPGADGIKTGYTDVALHCLLFEAVRDGRTLIGVVMGSPATGPNAGAQDAARILDWGFRLKRKA
ncbi:MAG TPA: D-alanyl-D-alanine carboxypeptidase [Trebonia sp.]|nr:D-alanyl-D-alanine carboxypeptidase [Trebonia sp.]